MVAEPVLAPALEFLAYAVLHSYLTLAQGRNELGSEVFRAVGSLIDPQGTELGVVAGLVVCVECLPGLLGHGLCTGVRMGNVGQDPRQGRLGWRRVFG